MLTPCARQCRVLGPEDEAAGGRRPGEAARLADTCEAVVVLVTCSYSAATELVLSVALASKVRIYAFQINSNSPFLTSPDTSPPPLKPLFS